MELPNFRSRSHIGIDESGKGDFFGPLSIAAVYTTPSGYMKLESIGVRDSKQIPAGEINRLALVIPELLGPLAIETIVIGPRRYNELQKKMGSVNRVLAWGHARALENLLARNPNCKIAVADQFADAHVLASQLFQMGRDIRLVQVPKGERDIAVAAASILARWKFTEAMQKLTSQFGFPVPLGAGPGVDEAAKRIAVEKGPAFLADVAKVHFRNLERVVDRPDIVRSLIEPR